MIKTITVTKKAKQIMYSIISPPFTEVLKQPPPFLYKTIISYLFKCNLNKYAGLFSPAAVCYREAEAG